MKYKNIIFDLYGTLADVWTDEKRKSVWDSLAWYFGLHQAYYSSKELKKAYFEEEKKQLKQRRKELGDNAEIDVVPIFETLYRGKGIICTKETLVETVLMYRSCSIRRLKLYDGIEDLLKSLKEAGKNVYLLTNAQRVFTEREIMLLGLNCYFDGIVYSSDEKIKKPDSAFYKTFMKKFNLNPVESVMVGNDGYCDVEGALEAGLQAVHVISNIAGSKPCPNGVKSIPVEEIEMLKNELLK